MERNYPQTISTEDIAMLEINRHLLLTDGKQKQRVPWRGTTYHHRIHLCRINVHYEHWNADFRFLININGGHELRNSDPYHDCHEYRRWWCPDSIPYWMAVMIIEMVMFRFYSVF